MTAIYIRPRTEGLLNDLHTLAGIANLPMTVVAEALLCKGIGRDHPHADTVRRALHRRRTPPDTLPLEG